MSAVQTHTRELAVGWKTWLFDTALPLWADKGVDRVNGGFHELLGLDGIPPAVPRRARVQPRQVYVFALAGRMGWMGPWEAIVRHGLDYYTRAYEKPDGSMRALVSIDGSPLDDSFDLYNQAFGLLAFAVSAESLQEPAWLRRAARLRDHLIATYAHPAGGFHRGNPPSEPLESNPHMHLFEAALEAEMVAKRMSEPSEGWASLADMIGNHCLKHFCDPVTGALREFFTLDWAPAPGTAGRIVEPGHQLEWAWLLIRWAERRGRSDVFTAARRLIDIAETHGFDVRRGVINMQLLDDFTIHDPVSRLWPHTEWVKAATTLVAIAASDAERDAAWAKAIAGSTALSCFFDVPLPGTFRDKIRGDGSVVDEPAPASSLYHIACAIDEFDRATQKA